MKKLITVVVLCSLLLTPSLAYAQSQDELRARLADLYAQLYVLLEMLRQSAEEGQNVTIPVQNVDAPAGEEKQESVKPYINPHHEWGQQA